MTNHGNGPHGDTDSGLNGSSSHFDSMFRGVTTGIVAALIVVLAVTLG